MKDFNFDILPQKERWVKGSGSKISNTKDCQIKL